MRRLYSQVASQRGRWLRNSVTLSTQRSYVPRPQLGTGTFPIDNIPSLLGQKGAIKRNSLPHLPDGRRLAHSATSPERIHVIEGIVEKVVVIRPSTYPEDFWGKFVISDANIDGEHKSRMKKRVIGGVPKELVKGDVVKFEAELVDHSKFGRRYQIISVHSIEGVANCQKQQFPVEKASSMENYLMEIPKVGRSTARLIFDHFGEKESFRVFADEVLENGTGLLKRLGKVEGLSNTDARSIVQHLRKERKRDVSLQKLLLFPVQYGIFISQKVCKSILERFGFDEKMMKEDPYRFIEVEGVSFEQVDLLGIGMGFADDSIERFRACIIDAMVPSKEQHTALLHGVFLEAMTDHKGKYKYNKHRVHELLPQLIKDNFLYRTEYENNVYIQHSSYYKKERGIAECIDKIIGSKSSLPRIRVDEEIKKELAAYDYTRTSDKQKDAITNALSHKVSVLTGGPGTGKTTILGALVNILKRMGAVVEQAAPTGKAAQKLQEATCHEARTLHSVIHAKENPNRDDERDPFDDEGQCQPPDYTKYDTYKLKGADFVIVDEASMMDTGLFFSLLSKIPDQCHLLLVGDIHQLPSIGPGQLLRDIIACEKINVTELTEILRQEKGSDIIRHAHAIKDGNVTESKYLQNSYDLDFSTKENVHFVEVLDTKEIPTKVKGIARIVKGTIGSSDDFKECQILTPTNELKMAINVIFQDLNSNPVIMQFKQFKASGKVFKINDRVVQTRNDYKKGVFNGTMGIISAGDEKKGNKDGISVSFDIGGKKPHIVQYDKSDAEDLDLAYAITVHKAQGSGFSVVVIALPHYPLYKLLTRKWIYTALTRAKHHVIIVGNKRSYSEAVCNTYDQKRTTLLRAFLEERLPNLNRVKAVVYKWIWTRGTYCGYGFARSSTNKEFFVHSSNFNYDIDLTAGVTVIEFDVKESDKQYDDAVNVDIIQ